MCNMSTLFCPNRRCFAVQHRMQPCAAFLDKHYDSIRAAYDNWGPGPDGPVKFPKMLREHCVPSCARMVSKARTRPCKKHSSWFRKVAVQKGWAADKIKILPNFQEQASLTVHSMRICLDMECTYCRQVEDVHEDYLLFSGDGLQQWLATFEAGVTGSNEGLDMQIHEYAHYVPACAAFIHNMGNLTGPERSQWIQAYNEDYAVMGSSRDKVVTWKQHKFELLNGEKRDTSKILGLFKRPKPVVSGKTVRRNVMMGERRNPVFDVINAAQKIKPQKLSEAQRRMTLD